METALSRHYIKGFNNAYFLAEYNPTLINKLITIEKDSDYINGLKDGKRTYELERQKSRINEIRMLRSKDDKNLQR